MLKAKEDRPTAAMAVMLLTFLLFTGIDASAKWLMQAGMALFAAVFWRYFIHLALVVVTSVIAGSGGCVGRG